MSSFLRNELWLLSPCFNIGMDKYHMTMAIVPLSSHLLSKKYLYSHSVN